MATTLNQVFTLEANPPAITVGGQARTTGPYGVGYTSPLVSRPQAAHENVASDAWTWVSNMLLEPTSISTTIEQILMTSNSFLIQTILPLRVTDKIAFKASKFVFKPYLPSKLPYFSVARFVKAETESREAALVRIGLGFTLEHNFMKSTLGQTFYLEHMKQISQAFIEQLNFDAVMALLDADMWALDSKSRIRDASGKVFVEQAADIMEREVQLWNYMQKTANAWECLNLWVDTQVARFTPERLNTWIIDQRIDGFRKHVPHDQTDFYIFGPGNRNGLNDGVQFFVRDNLGNTIYCTRGYKIDERPEFNPLESIQQTGEYYVNCDLPTTDYTIYTNGVRSMMIYNEDLDRMSILTLQDMINNCWRFNEQGELFQANELPKNRSDKYGDLEHDFLYHSVNGKIVPKTVFGQLDVDHFNLTNKLNLGESVCAALKMNLSPEAIGTMLGDLQRCVEVISQIRSSDANQTQRWVQALNAGVSGPQSFDLDGGRAADVAQNGWPLPPTHASYKGFKEIERVANSSAKDLLNTAFSSYYIELIRKNMPLFDTYVRKLDAMFPGCTLFSPLNVISDAANPSMYDAAFENLLTRNTLFVPLVLGGAGAARPGPDSANLVRLNEVGRVVDNIAQKFDIDDDVLRDLNAALAYPAEPDVTFFANMLFLTAVALEYDGNPTVLPGIIRTVVDAGILVPGTRLTKDRFVRLLGFLQPIAGLSQFVEEVRSIVFSSARTVVVSPLLLTAFGGATARDEDAEDKLAEYNDKYTGASVDIMSLPMIRKIGNGVAVAPGRPSRTTASTSLVARAIARRNAKSVGFNGGIARQPPIPTNTSRVPTPANVAPTINDVAATITPQMREHFNEACVRFANEPQYLFPVLAFLFTKINKRSVTASYSYNYMHYCNYVVLRAHQLYSTVGGLKTIAGEGTGNTFIAQMTANVANDNQTDEMMVHIAGFHGAMVTNNKRVFHAPNILVTKYHQGNGVGFIDPYNYSPQQGIFGASKDSSIIVIAVPLNERFGKCFSLSGALSMTNAQGQTVPIRTQDDKPFTYSSAGYYNRVYGFDGWNWNALVRGLTPREKFVPNHVVYASATLYQNQMTHKYDIATSNTGHWDTRLVGAAKGAQRVGKQALDEHCILSYANPASLTCIY